MTLKFPTVMFVFGAVSALACGGSPDGTATTPSLDGGAGDASVPVPVPVEAGVGCATPTPGATATCTAYASKSIADMRAAPVRGCFELPHVGLVARTDSASEPRLYVQDANGGDFSAILAKCSSAAQHKCAPAVAAKLKTLVDTSATGAQITLRGFYEYGSVTGFEELYIEDILDECATLPRPAPIALTVADVTRDARSKAKWFRRATINIGPQDPLVMYDFSPPELALAQPQCPNWEGFAMIPQSAGVAAATGCAGATNPAGRAAEAREVLFGRQFFNQFLFSSDCGCAGTKQKLMTATNTVSGTVTGYLLLEQDKGSTKPYQLFEPAADKAFPVK